MLFLMKLDLVPKIIVRVTQKTDCKKIVKMVVWKGVVSNVLRMLAILVMVEMFTGMIHVTKEEI